MAFAWNFLFLCTFSCLIAIKVGHAQSANDSIEEQMKASAFFTDATLNEPNRSDLLRPTLSLLFPGADQFASGQYGYGFLFASLGLSSMVLSSHYRDDIANFERSSEFLQLAYEQRQRLYAKDDRYRRFRLASQFYLFSGSLSAYQSFRTSALARRNIGEYNFLSSEDTVSDILLAPFDFSYFASPYSMVPLGLLSALVFLSDNDSYKADPFTTADGGFTSVFSYNAGTSEEALFRGWIMPYAMQQTNSLFWSNVMQSSLFALAHLNQTSFPIFQFGLGYYLGWLTQKQNWSVRESVFIHTWWDVIAFAAEYSRQKNTSASAKVLWLPALRLVF